MLINLNAIRDDADRSHLNENVTIQNINFFSDRRNRPNLENVALWGMILTMKSGNAHQQQQQNKSTSYGQNNKKQKTSWFSGKPFNRFILVADLSNPPHTFAITTSKLTETNLLLQNMYFDSFLGMSFYLVEPDITKTQLSKYTHVLSCEQNELLPLKWDTRAVRPTPIVLPPTQNETYYFVLNAQTVRLHRARVVQQPCCRGYQCDRQKKDECLCMHGAALSPITYEFDVEFDVNPRDFQGEDKHVCNFRSYRTTSVFFKEFEEFSNQTVLKNEKQRQNQRREKIKDIANYINSNGGWTIVGWVRRGEIAVDGEQEKIGNNQVNLRLSYLFPTDDTVLLDQQFRAIQIDASDVSDDIAHGINEV